MSSPSPGRRACLLALGAAPLAAFAPAPAASAADYASPGAALDDLERLAADVVARLRALGAGVPSSQAFVASVLRDHERLGRERRALRRRLGVPPAAAAPVPSDGDASLEALRDAQRALVYAHAEALPALAEPEAVARLARHLVEFGRHAAVVDLWIDAEAQRG